MKIYIDIIEGEPKEKQILAALSYLEKEGEIETGRDSGIKISHPLGYNHVSLTKTKKGNLSFRVWRAV